jgi:hypothetical protein
MHRYELHAEWRGLAYFSHQVRGEGCGALYLTAPQGSLSQSVGSAGEESLNGPYAGPRGVEVFMKATFVNQDGRSSSLTAPNGPAQQVYHYVTLHIKYYVIRSIIQKINTNVQTEQIQVKNNKIK